MGTAYDDQDVVGSVCIGTDEGTTTLSFLVLTQDVCSLGDAVATYLP